MTIDTTEKEFDVTAFLKNLPAHHIAFIRERVTENNTSAENYLRKHYNLSPNQAVVVIRALASSLHKKAWKALHSPMEFVNAMLFGEVMQIQGWHNHGLSYAYLESIYDVNREYAVKVVETIKAMNSPRFPSVDTTSPKNFVHVMQVGDYDYVRSFRPDEKHRAISGLQVKYGITEAFAKDVVDYLIPNNNETRLRWEQQQQQERPAVVTEIASTPEPVTNQSIAEHSSESVAVQQIEETELYDAVIYLGMNIQDVYSVANFGTAMRLLNEADILFEYRTKEDENHG